MNPNHLKSLCLKFNLGTPKHIPQRVYGGLLHIMWKLETDNGTYAIKQLSKDINLNDASIIDNYNLTEQIATKFKDHDIAAIAAISIDGKYLYLVESIGFLVYPWVYFKGLDINQISETRAVKIAKILAKIHYINLDIPQIPITQFDTHSNDKIYSLSKKVSDYNSVFSRELNQHLPELININESFHNATQLLKNHTVISHGDLDQKNVLWDENDNPVLIDWECAHKLNPTYEIVNAALDWSGISTNFNQQLFGKMIIAYKEASGIIDKDLYKNAFYGCLGNWINWLVYNINRSFNKDNLEQKQIGVEQVTQVLPTIINLHNLIPSLINII
jgi:thiamine kinase-like enzyme